MGSDKTFLNKDINIAEVAGIAHGLRLSDPGHVHDVESALTALLHKLWNIEHLATVGRTLREQRDYIQRIHKHLTALIQAFETADPVVNRTLGVALAHPLSEILGDKGISEIYPEIALPPDPRRRELSSRRRESVEMFDRIRVKNITDDQCIEVLLRLMTAIDWPLQQILEMEKDRKDKGGRRPNIYRRCVIQEAAKIFGAAGLRPTTTVNGKFEEFCAAILEMVGAPTEGLHDAIFDHLPR